MELFRHVVSERITSLRGAQGALRGITVVYSVVCCLYRLQWSIAWSAVCTALYATQLCIHLLSCNFTPMVWFVCSSWRSHGVHSWRSHGVQSWHYSFCPPFCIKMICPSGVYRQEQWGVPLAAALLELRECAHRQKRPKVWSARILGNSTNIRISMALHII